ncbi:threonine synthase [Maribacter sp.]|nr:threonine synthase [Maribacter sp.]
MLKYVSNKGGGEPVDIETAILNGYAPDGGLYVPEQLPQISFAQLEEWKQLSFKELAFEITSLFIDRSIVSAKELKTIIEGAYSTFEKETVLPIPKLKSQNDTYIMELFYGATLSFKDVGLSFLVNLVDFFLQRKQERLSVIVATTGDTGPAAASYVAGKSTLDVWVLYPKGLITDEQERQMTTLQQNNVHPVGVYNCADGGDDLDVVISKLYANQAFKNKVNLSSVNSINWGRVMIQTVHYFYGYFQVADTIGEALSMVVPSGAFGNLCAGGLARKMGLPIKNLVVANNKNGCLHRIFSEGLFSKQPIHETVSSAIDILIPMNFWRYLYFCIDKDAEKLKKWTEEFDHNGTVQFDEATFNAYKKGFLSRSVSDADTLGVIKEVFDAEGYLLDPHTAVSLVVANELSAAMEDHKVVCLATAHPAKFPAIIRQALGSESLPKAATHPSIENAKRQCQKGYTADHSHLEEALIHAMEKQWEQNRENRTA